MGLAVFVALAAMLLPAAVARAATFNVTTQTDEDNAGACFAGDPDCALREALNAANGAPLGQADTINLPAGNYVLRLGSLFSSRLQPVTVNGAGARTTFIDGNGATQVWNNSQAGDATLSGLTIRNGSFTGAHLAGGGISNSGAMTLTNVAVQGNNVSGEGGGIYHDGSRLTLTNVTVNNNQANSGADLGGPFAGSGGGLYVAGPGVTLTNVTVSGNSAGVDPAGNGGGIFNNGPGTMAMTNVTVAGNTVDSVGSGAGLFNNSGLTLRNSILAGNLRGAAAENCVNRSPITSAGGNLESGTDCGLPSTGNRRGVNPLLGPLQNNGGQTDTRALMAGSPAIDLGTSTGCPATDQRGVGRPQGPACDSGAFEVPVSGGGSTTPTPTPQPGQSGLPPPVLGRLVNAFPLRGTVLVSEAAAATRSGATGARSAQIKGRRFVPLREARQIRVGSFLDTRKGTVRLVSARNASGATQSGDFTGGIFQVLQSRKRSAKGLTELRLKGSSFRRCRAGRSQAQTSRLSRRRIRRLRSNARGRFRTRGRHSAATVRGTDWTVTDRCDGTLTAVKRGRVAVRDFRRRKTILLRRGKRYLARARR